MAPRHPQPARRGRNHSARRSTSPQSPCMSATSDHLCRRVAGQRPVIAGCCYQLPLSTVLLQSPAARGLLGSASMNEDECGHLLRARRSNTTNVPASSAAAPQLVPGSHGCHRSQIIANVHPPASDSYSCRRTPTCCWCDALHCNLEHMGAPVWGTFSVRDHCRPGAFVREVLLYDRLVVPYPDPNARARESAGETPIPRIRQRLGLRIVWIACWQSWVSTGRTAKTATTGHGLQSNRCGAR